MSFNNHLHGLHMLLWLLICRNFVLSHFGEAIEFVQTIFWGFLLVDDSREVHIQEFSKQESATCGMSIRNGNLNLVTGNRVFQSRVTSKYIERTIIALSSPFYSNIE